MIDRIGLQPCGQARDGGADDLVFERANLVLGFALLALAGGIDAVGLVRWHELFVSFMSGNTTRFGASPAQGNWPAFDVAARALLMFLVGVTGGETLAPLAGRWRSPAVVTIEAALLWLAAAAAAGGWDDHATTALAGLAMGVQTAAVHRADGVSLALTYVTGTLVNIGRSVAAALRGADAWSRVLPFAGFWLSLCAGSAAGAALARAGTDVALTAAAVLASALSVYAGAVAGHRAAVGSPQATKAPLR